MRKGRPPLKMKNETWVKQWEERKQKEGRGNQLSYHQLNNN